MSSKKAPKRISAIFRFAMQGNQESHLRITAPGSLHAGNVPNGVRWKNLLRRRLPCPAPLTPANRLKLELAKGFEPPTP